MTTEFNLSERQMKPILKGQNKGKYFMYFEEDVKEFIKILIEELTDITKPIHKRDGQQIICKYAGDKLI